MTSLKKTVKLSPATLPTNQLRTPHSDQTKHRFQIFKKLGVKFDDLFLWTEQLQRNLDFFTVNLLLDFSEIFNIFRITVCSSFFKDSRKFSKKI